MIEALEQFNLIAKGRVMKRDDSTGRSCMSGNETALASTPLFVMPFYDHTLECIMIDCGFEDADI